ncbi:MAG: helix-hairpin-helix domain-containing protein [Ruminococcus sp.]|nr:helix-hairpin-helix domain-containing protein [Ruminococcus sp.]
MHQQNNQPDPAPEKQGESPPKVKGRGALQITTIVLLALIFVTAVTALIIDRISVTDGDIPIRRPESSAESAQVTQTKASSVREKPADARITEMTALTAAPVSPEYTFPADINLADEDMLASVSGISRSVAQSIIRYRDKNGIIHNYEELLGIYGIGERTLNVIRDYFFISENDYQAPVTQTQTEKITAPPKTRTVTERTTRESTTASITERTSGQTVPTEELPPPERRTVNINTADAREIADALLISDELAEAIVELRNNILYFTDPRELLYVEGFGNELLGETIDYIITSDSPEENSAAKQ